MRRSPHFAVLGALIGILYLSGGLDFVERYLLDVRAGLATQPATGDVVIVAIDPESLRSLEVWPWPRVIVRSVVDLAHSLQLAVAPRASRGAKPTSAYGRSAAIRSRAT